MPGEEEQSEDRMPGEEEQSEDRIRDALDTLWSTPPNGLSEDIERRMEAAETVWKLAESEPETVLEEARYLSRVIVDVATASAGSSGMMGQGNDRPTDVDEINRSLGMAVLAVTRAASRESGSVSLVQSALRSTDASMLIPALNAVGRLFENQEGQVIDAEDASRLATAVSDHLTHTDTDVAIAAAEQIAAIADSFPKAAAEHVGQIAAATDPMADHFGTGHGVFALQRIATERPSRVAAELDAVSNFIDAHQSDDSPSGDVVRSLFLIYYIAKSDPDEAVNHIDTVARALEAYSDPGTRLQAAMTLERLAAHSPSAVTVHAKTVVSVLGELEAPEIEAELMVALGRAVDEDPECIGERLDPLLGTLRRAVDDYDSSQEETVRIITNAIGVVAGAGQQDLDSVVANLDVIDQVAATTDRPTTAANVLSAYKAVAESQPAVVAERVDRVVNALGVAEYDRAIHMGLAALSGVAMVDSSAMLDHVDRVAATLDDIEDTDGMIAGIGILIKLGNDSTEAVAGHEDTLLNTAAALSEPQIVAEIMATVAAVAESDPDLIAPRVGHLFELLDGFEDLAVVEQDLAAIRAVARDDPAAVSGYIERVGELFDRFSDEYIRSKLCTIIGTTALDRPDAAAEQLPRITDTITGFESRPPLVNGVGSVGEIAEHRPADAAEYLGTIADSGVTREPLAVANFTETLRYVAPTAPAVAREHLDIVLEALHADDDRVREEGVRTLGALAEEAPDAVATGVETIVTDLTLARDPTEARVALEALTAVAATSGETVRPHQDVVTDAATRFDDSSVSTVAEELLETIEEGTTSN